LLGSTTGNEDILLAGQPTLNYKTTATNINLFNNTTGAINIGSATATPTIAGTLICNTIYSNDVGAGVSIGYNVTTGINQIGGQMTSGNIQLHNGTSGTGRIKMNRNIVLPTSTSFTTPATGELGYTISNSGSQASAVSGTTYALSTISLLTGTWQINVYTYFNPSTTGSTTFYNSVVSATSASLTPYNNAFQLNLQYGITMSSSSPTGFTYSGVINAGGAGLTLYVNSQIGITAGTWTIGTNWTATRIA
jgi:hypothetical protein